VTVSLLVNKQQKTVKYTMSHYGIAFWATGMKTSNFMKLFLFFSRVYAKLQQYRCIFYLMIMMIMIMLIIIIIFFLWRCDPTRVMASSFMMFLDHTRRTTVGRTPQDEWSARRRDFYLTTHEHSQQTNIYAPQCDSNPRSQQASGCRPTP
jgi:hypothetical protein